MYLKITFNMKYNENIKKKEIKNSQNYIWKIQIIEKLLEI